MNADGREFGNALRAAISQDWKKMTSPLSENGADVNAQGDFTAVLCKLLYLPTMVSFLLMNRADLNKSFGLLGYTLEEWKRKHPKV